MKTKKKLIILISIIILILLIITILYFTTNLFKSKEKRFWKYFAQNKDIINLFINDKNNQQIQFKAENSYTSTGNLELKIGQKDKSFKELNATSTIRHDNLTNRTYADATLKNGDLDLFKLSYINSEDIHAIKCDEVFPNYVGIKNSNLTELASNYGINNFPNSINLTQYTDLLEINDEQLKQLSDTYLPIIMNEIEDDQYSKNNTIIELNGKEYGVEAYSVSLTSDNFKRIVIECLNTFDITSAIEEIIEYIQEMNIQNNINLNIFIDKGKTIRTEISSDGLFNITYDKTTDLDSLIIEVNQNISQELGEQFSNIINKNKNESTINNNSLENNNNDNDDEEMDLNDRTSSENTNNIEDYSNNNLNEIINLNEVATEVLNEKYAKITLTRRNDGSTTTNTLSISPDVEELNSNIILTINMSEVQNNQINNSYNIEYTDTKGDQTQTLTILYNINTTKVDQIEEIPELSNSNTAIANNYEPSVFKNFMTSWFSILKNKLSEKMVMLGFEEFME